MSPHRPPLLGEPLPLELVNTRFARRGHEQDGFETPADLADWLERVADRLPLAPSPDALAAIGPHELDAARTLRDALRTLLLGAIEGSEQDAAAREAVNEAVRAAPRWRELPAARGPAVAVSAAPPVAAALGAIAEAGVELLCGADAAALRACRAPGCMLLYRQDHPRRAWCSPRCSNRVRAARHYARRTAGPR